MFKPIAGLPDNVIGIEATGHVEADDYRNVLIPAIAKATEAHDKVRALIVMGDDYESVSMGSLAQEDKVWFKTRKDWERVAVVTDHNHMRGMVHMFAWMYSGEMRTYTMDQMDDAKAWLGET